MKQKLFLIFVFCILTVTLHFTLPYAKDISITNVIKRIPKILAQSHLSLYMQGFYIRNLYTKEIYNKVTVLCFHNIDGKGAYSIKQETFHRYLNEIKKQKIQIISLKKLWQHNLYNIPFTQPSMVLTIDDNYKNIVRILAPILRTYDYTATFFVYTQAIHKNPRAGVSWDDLNRLYKEGFDIQNHSYSHTRFHKQPSHMRQKEYQELLYKEIVLSKQKMEQNIPKLKIWAFAYPMNYYNQSLEKTLIQNNYPLRLSTDAISTNVLEPFKGLFHRFAIERQPDSNKRLQAFFYKQIKETLTPIKPEITKSRQRTSKRTLINESPKNFSKKLSKEFSKELSKELSKKLSKELSKKLYKNL